MPGLLSGSSINASSPSGYANPTQLQYQLGPTPTTSTGYTLVSTTSSVVNYTSSLGNIQFSSGTAYSNVIGQSLNLIGTGTTSVLVSGGTTATTTNTGALVVQGGMGVWGTIRTGADINVNGLTIGQGWVNPYDKTSRNNIVINGVLNTSVANANDGENSVSIGYNTLKGIDTALNVIAIGSNVINTGTTVTNTIAIGNNALQKIGSVKSVIFEKITLIDTTTNAIYVTIPSFDQTILTTGSYVTFSDILGTTELNDKLYYINAIDINRVQLFYDVNVTYPVSGIGYSTYVSDGYLRLTTKYNDNIAIGTNAASNLFDGEQNFFLGDNLATNLTTGSYNLFIGHDVANNMVKGSGNISIGGDNLVNGVNNQINIGALLYYDGAGYTQINSNLGAGLGTWATATTFATAISTATTTNPVVITTTATFRINSGTEIIISDVVGMTELNKQVYFASYLSSNTISIYYDWKLTQPVDGTGFGSYVSGGIINELLPNGALSILGGVGIAGNLVVKSPAEFYSRMTVKKLITGSITTATNLTGGDLGSIPYQISPGRTQFIPIGGSNTVLTSNGSTATWSDLGNIATGAATSASTVTINADVPLATYYLTLAEQIGGYSNLDADYNLTFITTSQNTSSYFATGTSVLNVPGSIYSMDGNPDENNWLYTPRVTISAVIPPANPRIGDFWIDPAGPYELQYVNDGGNFIWVQFTGL